MRNLKLGKQMARNWVDTRMKNRAALYKHFCCVCSPAVSKDWHRSGSGVSACIDKIFSRGLVGHWRTGRRRGERVWTWRKYFQIREEETKREKSLRGCHCGMKEASVWKEPCGKGGGRGEEKVKRRRLLKEKEQRQPSWLSWWKGCPLSPPLWSKQVHTHTHSHTSAHLQDSILIHPHGAAPRQSTFCDHWWLYTSVLHDTGRTI